MKKLLTCSLLLVITILLTSSTLAQNVTVNPGAGSYATLKDAFDAINLGTHTGTITVDIVGNTSETATAVLNASGSGSASYTSITISPSGGAARTISGAIAAGSPLIDLNGADNVSINGLNSGGNSLTIENTTVSSTSGTSTIRLQTDATNNLITNCSILGAGTMAVGTNGGNIWFGASAISSGNDNNTISYCNIGPSGSNLPSKGIYGNGTTTTGTLNNSGISITNCNIYDYFAAAVTSAGIYITSGNTDWTISNNKFYQTATRTQTTSALHTPITISNTSGNNFQIIGNTIGYASSSATGIYTITGVSNTFRGIYLSVGTTTASSVQGNTITAISQTTAASGTSTSSPCMMMYVGSGLTTIGDVTGNTIGSQAATGSITYTSSSSSTSDVIGMFNFGSSNWTVSNNTIGGITVSNSSTGAANVYGIRLNTSASVTTLIQNNTVGGSVASSIQSTTTATGSIASGIYLSTSLATVTGNTIRNITAAGGTGTTTSASVMGITFVSTSVNNTVSQNVIHTLSNTNASAATTITGIQYTSSSGTNLISRNILHSFNAASATAIMNGIQVSAGTTTYQNNMIRLGIDASGSDITTGCTMNGINELGGTNNFYFNSVYLGGTGVGGTLATYAFNSAVVTNTRNYRDNIFQNSRSNGAGTGKHYAVKVAGTAPNPAGLTINNNVYYANGTGGVFGFFNSADVANLAAWQTAVGQDGTSFYGNPQFQTPNGSASTVDLHINPSINTPIEGNGFDIVSVTDDYDGQTRSGLTPVDIGADAGNFIGSDLAAPIFSYTLLANTSSTTNRILTATITDASGVPIADPGMPRLYWREGFDGTYTGVTPTYLGSNQYQYSFGSGVATSDTVFYYLVARDNAGTPNLGSSPSGASGFSYDPPAASTPPPSPNSYRVISSISGSVNVGSGETYTSFTNDDAGGLFKAINERVVTGNITVNITSDLTETGAVALNQTVEEAIYTITIRPSAATNRNITGSYAGGLIRLNGADSVTFDGRFGGSGNYLTFSNTSASANSAVFQLISLGTGAGATGNTIRNCNISAGINSVSSTFGIYSGSSAISTSGTGADNDYLSIKNNVISNSYYGIYARGVSSTGLLDGLNIIENTIGSNNDLLTVTYRGVDVQNASAPTISQNEIFNLKISSSASNAGIDMGQNVTDAVVSRNKIYGLKSLSTSGYGTYGINISSSTGTSNININNNVIYDLVTDGDGTSTTFNPFGIRIVGGTNHKVYYNSVNLFGSFQNVTTSDISSAFIVTSSSTTGLDVRDNIFANSMTGGAGTKSYAAYVVSGTTFGTIDYNDYYISGSFGMLGYYGADVDSIAEWRIASSGDVSSIDLNPNFSSNTILQPLIGSPVLAAGTPIGSVTIDFLGTSRSGTNPSIGAYENGSSVDISGPVISFTVLGNTTSTSNRSLTPVTITDLSGVNGTSGTAPRVYFKKKSDANAFGGNTSTDNGWKWTESTGGSPFTFTIDYSIINGGSAAGGDTIQYFVVAQDLAGTPNVTANPAAGFIGTSVSAITSAPSAPNSYIIFASISGTVTVGSGGTYPSLTGAGGLFATINANMVTGNVTVNILSDLTEDGTNALNQWTEEPVNSNFTLTIQPSAATERLISGDVSTGMIRLNGADRVTIDGRFSSSGKYLRFRNINTSDPTIRIINGSANNIIRNCIIEGSATSTTDGVVHFSTGNNLNNTLLQNDIRDRSDAAGRPATGIYFSSGADSSTAIMNCNIYDFISYGIYLSAATGTLVDSNDIYMNTASTASTIYGIYVANTSATIKTIIAKNKIHDLNGTASATIKGIYYSGSSGTAMSVSVENNSISLSPVTTGSVDGIDYFGWPANNIYLYYNSVYIGGTATAGNSYGIHHRDDVNEYVQYNNVVQNARSGGTGKHYAMFFDIAQVNTYVGINYNDYYANGTSGFLGYWGTDISAIANWKTTSLKDSNSLGSDPLYNSSNDLRPQNGSPVLSAGVPIAGITTDITNASRSGTNPAMGAYEVGGDLAGPIISYTALTNTNSTSNRTLTSVTITDFSGVDWTNTPRIYFKKSTDANVFGGNTSTDNGWKWTNANIGSSPTNFTIDYSIINGGSVSEGNFIQYFVVAQDIPGNVSANPSPGFVGTSVSSVSSAPASPNQYKIVGAPLSGDYNIIVPPLKEFNQKFNRKIALEKRTRKIMREVSFIEEVLLDSSKQKDQPTTDLNTKNKSIDNSDTHQRADLESETTILSSSKNVYTATDGSLVGVDVAEQNDSDTNTEIIIRYEKIEMDEEYFVLTENGIEVDWRTIRSGLEGFTETTYPSIQDAVNDLNERGVSGAVRFLLGSASYTETLPIVINEVIGASATNTVTFKPNTSITTSITGTPTSIAMFHLDGADYIIFDGSNIPSGSSRNWTLTNGSSSIPVFRLENDATNNVIKNLILETQNTSSTSGAIVLLSTTGTAGNSNDTITNNKIKDNAGSAYYTGIYSAGNSSARNSNNSIVNNEITNFTNYGVYVTTTGNGSNWNISDNNFYNSLTPSSSQYSIYLAPGIAGGGGHIISKNFIGGSTVNCGGTAWTNSGATTFVGVYASVDTIASSTISDNTIQNINVTYTSSSAFTGINLVAGRATISGNLVGHSSTANSIQVAGSSTTHGIRIASTSYTSPVIVNNNTVANMTASGTGTSVRARGIMVDGSNTYYQITNNTINNLSSAGSGTGIALGSANAVGIYSWAGASNFMTDVLLVISGNTIHTIQGTNTGAYASVVAGVTVTNFNGTVNKNKIYDIANSSTGSDPTAPPIAAGVFFRYVGDPVNVIDNFISLGSGQTNGNMFVGIINVIGDTGNRLYTYYNTVKLSGTVTSGGLRTAAFQRGNNTTTDTVKTTMFIKNNIFDNARSGGTAGHYAIANQNNLDPLTGWSSTASDFNVLNSSSTSRVGLWGTLDRTFAEWKSSSGGDVYSQSGITVNYTDIVNGDLHLTGGSIGDGNLAALPIAGLSTDIDNETRDPYWPYMGADEVTASPLSLKLTLKSLIEGFYASAVDDTITVYFAKTISPYTKYIPVRGLTSVSGYDFYLPKTNNESSYYIVVNHRNSVETWSNSPISTASFPASYDFTSASSQAYGSNLVQISGASGLKWCFYGGDVNQDGVVDLLDMIDVDNDAFNFAFGYLPTDVNGDSNVDLLDMIIVDNNSYNFVGAVIPSGPLSTRVQRQVIHKDTSKE